MNGETPEYGTPEPSAPVSPTYNVVHVFLMDGKDVLVHDADGIAIDDEQSLWVYKDKGINNKLDRAVFRTGEWKYAKVMH